VWFQASGFEEESSSWIAGAAGMKAKMVKGGVGDGVERLVRVLGLEVDAEKSGSLWSRVRRLFSRTPGA
jgi:hypothetical protein